MSADGESHRKLSFLSEKYTNKSRLCWSWSALSSKVDVF